MFSYYSQWIAKYLEKGTHSLIQANSFSAEKAFEYLRAEIENAIVSSITEIVPFTIETNASYHSIAASLKHSGRPVTFFLRTLFEVPANENPLLQKRKPKLELEALHNWTSLHFTYWAEISCIHVWFKTGWEDFLKW